MNLSHPRSICPLIRRHPGYLCRATAAVLFLSVLGGGLYISQSATSAASVYYVAPNGAPANDGSEARPLDIVTALSNRGPVRPGDTVWLRGGVYRKPATPNSSGDLLIFESQLTGTEAAPIIVRQYPGERAILDGNLSPDSPVLSVVGSYSRFWGFEITNSDTNRYVTRGTGLNAYGHHNRFINLIIHDTGQGVGFWGSSSANDSELYGALISNVGNESSDRGHGHSIYVQNAVGTKWIRDNILFNGFSFGIHAYTENGRIDNLWMEGNIFFNHGILSATGGLKSNLLFAGSQMAQYPTVIDNYGYYPAGSAGRVADVTECNQGRFQGNYFAGGTPLNIACSNTVVNSNTLYGPVSGSVKTAYPNNFFGTTPTGVFLTVRPNAYEPGRSHVVIYNWAKMAQVTDSLAGSGLVVGDRYEVRDAQNYLGNPVGGGIYDGHVTFPMTGLTVAPPIGSVPIPPSHTAPEFGVFVVQRVIGAGPVANLSAAPTSINAGQTATLSWSSDATSVTLDQGIGVVAASGSRVVSPAVTTTYTLTATNASGSTIRSSTVTVLLPPSADGTMVPPAAQIVDTTGSIWTLGSDLRTLRNGAQMGGGYGSKMLWTSSTVYALGTDSNWWKWGGASWTKVGPTQPGSPVAPPSGPPSGPSPDGTMAPPAAQIVDAAGTIWTIGSDLRTLRNGAQAGGGYGTKLLWTGSTVYVLGTDNNWWKWGGTSWTKVGPTQPGVPVAPPSEPPSGPSPDGTMAPPAAQIVDTAGSIWTISGNSIIRNGVGVGGLGTKLLWTTNTLYVFGTDNNWYRWGGTGWTNVGSTQPGGPVAPPSGPSPDGTMTPPAAQVVDSAGAIWTIGSSQRILRNGTQVGTAAGSKLLWTASTVYVFGTDGNWWKWGGTTWTRLGPTQPS